MKITEEQFEEYILLLKKYGVTDIDRQKSYTEFTMLLLIVARMYLPNSLREKLFEIKSDKEYT